MADISPETGDKTAIRKWARQQQRLAAQTPFVFDNLIVNQLVDILAPYAVIGSYCAMPQEADPAALTEMLHDEGKAIGLPVIGADGHRLDFARWTPDSAMVMGAHHIRIPEDHSVQVTPEAFLVPLVAFDRHCNRLGHGKGHYDRLFERYPDALRIGIAWSQQEIAAVPTDPWDVPLHAIATQNDWITR